MSEKVKINYHTCYAQVKFGDYTAKIVYHKDIFFWILTFGNVHCKDYPK